MAEIGYAQMEIKEELKLLWLTSFDDIPEAVDLFFETWFLPGNGIQALEDGKVVSALYLLPARIQGEGKTEPAHYIYGASTLPEYRGRGLMRQLLQFADTTAAQARGEKFSVLLPASKDLYGFYRKSGYREGFYTRMVEVDRSALAPLAKKGESEMENPAVSMWKLRQDSLSRNPGCVQWGADVVEYAAAINQVYGGKRIAGPWGYALYRGEDTVEVLEWLPKGEDSYLLGELLSCCEAKRFCFRLPADSGLLPGQGKTIPFGMIKSLSNGPKMEAIRGKIPYLGLTLD